jgi:hypothetical protein
LMWCPCCVTCCWQGRWAKDMHSLSHLIVNISCWSMQDDSFILNPMYFSWFKVFFALCFAFMNNKERFVQNREQRQRWKHFSLEQTCSRWFLFQ